MRRYFLLTHRLFVIFWISWLAYWLVFVHWKWANVLSHELPRTERNAGTVDSFWPCPATMEFLKWLRAETRSDAEIVGMVKHFYFPGIYDDLDDIDLAQRIRARYERFTIGEDKNSFSFEGLFEQPSFFEYFTIALQRFWRKSRPHGVEFLAGLLAPGAIYVGGVCLFRWVIGALKVEKT